jgi:PAS domain S-box-containing protein
LDLKGCITEWNAGAQQLFGYAAGEIVGQEGRIIFTPEDLAKGQDELEMKTALESGRAVDERWHMRKNCDRFWGSGMMMPFLDSRGRPVGFIKILQDQTDRMRMREALERNAEFYRSMVETAEDYAIYMLDRTGHVESWNTGAERIEGYRAEEIIGQHFSIFFTDEDVRKHLPAQELERAEKEGKSRTEAWAVRKDGSKFRSDWTLTPIRNHAGEIRGFCKIAHDVTARKEAEDQIRSLTNDLEERVWRRTAQLEASNKELESFSYSISHDLRAPLRHVSAYVDILREENGPELSAGARIYLEKISTSAERMSQLIEDLLNFSRSSSAEIQVKTVDLSALVNEVIFELSEESAGRRVKWVIERLPHVLADPAMLRQVLTNLISNALKYTRNRVAPRIELGSSENEKEFICFVRDNGVGFDMHFAGKLFGIFQRLHSNTEFPGTGIGLAIVQRTIHRHGGRVWAEGSLGTGATFYFSLPKNSDEILGK